MTTQRVIDGLKLCVKCGESKPPEGFPANARTREWRRRSNYNARRRADRRAGRD